MWLEVWTQIGKAVQKREKQEWARGVYFIDQVELVKVIIAPWFGQEEPVHSSEIVMMHTDIRFAELPLEMWSGGYLDHGRIRDAASNCEDAYARAGSSQSG